MSNFLRPPREVRDLIYEYCLVVEGILDPCTPYYEEQNPRNAKHKPDTALLRVNRYIGDEAAQVLYDKLVGREKNIIRYVHHIVLKFDSRDIDHESLVAISRARFSGQSNPDPDTWDWDPAKGDAGNIHETREAMLSLAWDWKRENTNEMFLKSVVLDFSNCFCPSGCCRHFDYTQEYAFADGRHSWPGCNDSVIESVEVFGLIDDSEKEQAKVNGWIEDEKRGGKRAWLLGWAEIDFE